MVSTTSSGWHTSSMAPSMNLVLVQLDCLPDHPQHCHLDHHLHLLRQSHQPGVHIVQLQYCMLDHLWLHLPHQDHIPLHHHPVRLVHLVLITRISGLSLHILGWSSLPMWLMLLVSSVLIFWLWSWQPGVIGTLHWCLCVCV